MAPAAAEAATIILGVTTTNAVEGPTTYALLFGSPITPDFYTTATAIAELTLTPGPSDMASVNVSPIYPSYVSGYGTLGGAPTNLGVDLGTTSCVATGGVSTTCSFALITNTFSPTFFDGLEALLTYQQTGTGSVAAWTATVTLTDRNVPEPASVLLFATGLLGAGVRRWRQKAR
jgi:hypothetical protein